MKKLLSMLLIVLLATCSVGVVAFADTGLIAIHDEVTYGKALQTLEVISGDAKGNLHGDNELTRGELIAIISKLETPKNDTFVPPSKPSFSDVPKTHWAYAYVERAKAQGITEGVGGGKFGINDKVSYKQAQAFMLNLLDIPYEWFDVQYDAICLGVEAGEAIDSPVFTRDMMFEVLFKTLVCNNNDDVMYFDVVADTTSIGWDASDREYILEVYNAIIDPNQAASAMTDTIYTDIIEPLTVFQREMLGDTLADTYEAEMYGREFEKLFVVSAYAGLSSNYDTEGYRIIHFNDKSSYAEARDIRRILALGSEGEAALEFGYVDTIGTVEAEAYEYSVNNVFVNTTETGNYYVVDMSNITDSSDTLRFVYKTDLTGIITSGILFGNLFCTPINF